MSLNVGEPDTIQFAVSVTPGDVLGPYASSVAATEDPKRGPATADRAQSDAVTLLWSALGVSKSLVSGPILGEDGSFTVTYGVTVANTGNRPLTNVQVTDDLASVFGAASGWSVIQGSITSGELTANGAFTGMGEGTGLLGEGVSLDVGESDTIQFTVSVTPGEDVDYRDTVEAIGHVGSGVTTAGVEVTY